MLSHSVIVLYLEINTPVASGTSTGKCKKIPTYSKNQSSLSIIAIIFVTQSLTVGDYFITSNVSV